ncbi:2-amino-4-hydroxy-6-hydroxymethyldihydropteridine diphosphokinase [Macrococcus hajekii]|uniref:2-amino-4-hydroxy-6-hydroxymethyldihydropteridine diphosphokinase n=1 Tax=Macrococcus hajekii TaxID=198482 RepID=A0A4R6BHU9_9STAP|nr:2-amino-4-hydroxy-6-hydroxymethyldihydropteridine diphosphokinase [Macrococcus hajekii]TDM01024.1 2-amino-4-hydroxy-6-hydroxymethyldihydropteridine diphosphokinase [Macrococcus hajekii]GGB12986.1 2-amino-4-hydroxy-6-hydroxymethyldihydropteridine diphosphokinase [Macrococcus hajekii]
MSTIYLSLGSNIGDRAAQLRKALELLGNEVQVDTVSSVYETAPVGGVEQADFYNICAVVTTDRSPEEMLLLCQQIEKQLNRVRIVHWGPRTIDLDILMIDEQIVDQPDLKVPHPYMTERSFVLIPLAEIAADAIHPVRKQPIKDLVFEDRDVMKTKVRL